MSFVDLSSRCLPQSCAFTLLLDKNNYRLSPDCNISPPHSSWSRKPHLQVKFCTPDARSSSSGNLMATRNNNRAVAPLGNEAGHVLSGGGMLSSHRLNLIPWSTLQAWSPFLCNGDWSFERVANAFEFWYVVLCCRPAQDLCYHYWKF